MINCLTLPCYQHYRVLRAIRILIKNRGTMYSVYIYNNCYLQMGCECAASAVPEYLRAFYIKTLSIFNEFKDMLE
jgi:hypothetical protein